MKTIYLVQKMERKEFKYYAHKGIKVQHLQYHGQVRTLWCESKRKAIMSCRVRNHWSGYEVFFATPIKFF